MREIQKYHDGRYRSIDAVYLCGEIGNPEKERVFVPLDRVLGIIDAEAWSYCDYILEHKNGNFYMQTAASHLSNNIREAVEALKGEQE